MSQPRGRKLLGGLDTEQRDFISVMLEGVYSAVQAADACGVHRRTAEDWMRGDHPVRRRYLALLAAQEDEIAALRRVLNNPGVTDYTVLKASERLREVSGLTKEFIATRDRRNEDRRAALENERRWREHEAREADEAARGPSLALVEGDGPGDAQEAS